MVTDKGIHDLEMSLAGQMFDGYYYFGGENGALFQENGETPEGFPVDESGKVETKNLGMKGLKTRLTELLSSYEGLWSVYVKDLTEDKKFEINSQSLYSASLIKVFVMAQTYANMDAVLQNEAEKLKKDISDPAVSTKVNDLLWNMITVSDNDAANTLTTYLGGGDSAAGMQAVNSFCQAHGYDQTHMGRMLLASNENDDNYTSVGDCGHLLQEIYKQDTSGYTHAADMFNLLKAQTRCNKIPAQLPEGVKTANKTGELDNVENDAGIIYDSKNDVVIVFMSQNLSSAGSAQNTIATLSRTIYDYYN